MNATHLASLIKRHLRRKPQDQEILADTSEQLTGVGFSDD